MAETPEPSVYEKAFAKSDKTDAILVVDGKKLHVNKAIFSYHSDYFNKLFNSEFEEKSIEEIPIEDVNFENFATVLSLVHGGPIKSSNYYSDKHLDLAERFEFPAAKRHLELFLMNSDQNELNLIRIADKYRLNDLMNVTLSRIHRGHYYSYSDYPRKPEIEWFEQLSDETNIKLLHRFLEAKEKTDTIRPNIEITQSSIYESTFVKTDKTDGILVVDGKKLHVNKAVLSYHSDFFNALFNSNFIEKSMKEIEIKDVNFENFAILLSMVHLNPIAPTNKENAMKVVELSDRFFVPSAKFLLKPFIYSSPLSNVEKIRIGELYDDQELCQEGIDTLKLEEFTELRSDPNYQALSYGTKKKLFHKCLELHRPYY